MISLKNTEPLAKGHSRLVFQHPEDVELLIKVIRPDIIEERFGSGTPWYKRLRRFGRFLSYHREIDEFLAIHASHQSSPAFLPEIIGFSNTDLGLGLVIRAVKTPNGDLAPSLGELLRTRSYGPKTQQRLEECFESILECDVIVSDLNVGNFVFLADEDRFVLIDGIGNTNPLAFKAFSKPLNRRHKLRRFARFRKRIERYLAQYGEPLTDAAS